LETPNANAVCLINQGKGTKSNQNQKLEIEGTELRTQENTSIHGRP